MISRTNFADAFPPIDPDSLEQAPNVLRRIVDELGGRLGLDCAVVAGGILEEGAPVFLED